jgi:hypothetical protein
MERNSELDTHKNIDIMRERYEKIIEIPSEERTSHDLFELMLFTSTMKIFEEIKMSKIHEELCKNIRLKNFEKGEIIFKQGDEGDNYYFILNGAVDLFIFDIDYNTGKTILSLNQNCYAGEGFGELAIKFDCPRSFTAISVTKTTCLFLGKKIYKENVKDFHEKKLFELIKFITSISIFKNQNIKNIIKFCIKSQKEKLNSYKPFIKYHDYLNKYIIISTGVIKCFYKIKVTNTFLENSINLTEDDFIQYLTNLQSMEVDSEVSYAEICKKKKSVAKFVKLYKQRNYKAIKEEKDKSILSNIFKKYENFHNNDERNVNDIIINNNNKKKINSSFLLNLKFSKNEENKINDNFGVNQKDTINEEDNNNNNEIKFNFKSLILNKIMDINNNKNNKNDNNNISIVNSIINSSQNKANETLKKSNRNLNINLNLSPKSEEGKLNLLRIESNNNKINNYIYSSNINETNNYQTVNTKENKFDSLISPLSHRIHTIKSGFSNDINKIITDYEREEAFFPNSESDKKRGKDIVYNEIIEIMEFVEKDMVCEYYASKSRKIDVFLLPVLPTEIYTIKTDEFREIFPDISEAIKEYSRPIFESKRVFRKLYLSIKWSNAKKDLLKKNVLSNK